MKYYLWYDEISKSFVIGKSSEYKLSQADILYVAHQENLHICQKIAENLNAIA